MIVIDYVHHLKTVLCLGVDYGVHVKLILVVILVFIIVVSIGFE